MKIAIASVVIAVMTCYVVASYQINKAYSIGYKSGYIEGVSSVKKPDTDNLCVAWMFNANFKQVKKRICTKGQL